MLTLFSSGSRCCHLRRSKWRLSPGRLQLRHLRNFRQHHRRRLNRIRRRVLHHGYFLGFRAQHHCHHHRDPVPHRQCYRSPHYHWYWSGTHWHRRRRKPRAFHRLCQQRQGRWRGLCCRVPGRCCNAVVDAFTNVIFSVAGQVGCAVCL